MLAVRRSQPAASAKHPLSLAAGDDGSHRPVSASAWSRLMAKLDRECSRIQTAAACFQGVSSAICIYTTSFTSLHLAQLVTLNFRHHASSSTLGSTAQDAAERANPPLSFTDRCDIHPPTEPPHQLRYYPAAPSYPRISLEGTRATWRWPIEAIEPLPVGKLGATNGTGSVESRALFRRGCRLRWRLSLYFRSAGGIRQQKGVQHTSHGARNSRDCNWSCCRGHEARGRDSIR